MLTAQDLKSIGIPPCDVFGKILKTCTTLDEAREFWEQNKPKPKVKESVKMQPFSVWEWLCESEFFKGMCSREFPGQPASNSEKRRWLMNKSVRINGQTPGPDDIIEPMTTELVFFPTSPSRITML